MEPPKYRDELFSTIKELKIQIIDFGDKLEENGDPLAYFPWRLGGHYNATGYALLAQQIIDEVQELAHMYWKRIDLYSWNSLGKISVAIVLKQLSWSAHQRS